MSSGNWSVAIDAYNTASRTWSGTDDPKKKKWNPYQGDHATRFSNKDYQYSVQYNGAIWLRLDAYTYYTVLNPIIPNSEITALTSAMDLNGLDLSAWNKLYDEIVNSDFNAGVAAGELHETVTGLLSLVKGTVRGLYCLRYGDVPAAFRSFTRGLEGAAHLPYYANGLANARRRRLADERRHRQVAERALDAGDVSSLWLAFQYGWLPLMSDINALIQLLDDGFDNQKMTVSTKASRKVVRGPRVVGDWGLPLKKTYILAPGTWARCTIKYFAEVKRVPRPIDRLGLTDPVTIVWELVPFSFVVDWFIPIGDWLKGRSVVPYLDTRVWKSTHWVYKQDTPAGWWPYSDTIEQMNQKGNLSVGMSLYKSGRKLGRVLSFNRASVVATPPLPSFKGVEKAFSLTHIGNAAALIHQLFR